MIIAETLDKNELIANELVNEIKLVMEMYKLTHEIDVELTYNNIRAMIVEINIPLDSSKSVTAITRDFKLECNLLNLVYKRLITKKVLNKLDYDSSKDPLLNDAGLFTLSNYYTLDVHNLLVRKK